MRPERKRRLKTVLVILGGLALALFLALKALDENINHFYTASQLTEEQVNQRVRLGGMVKEGSVTRIGEGLDVVFIVQDDKAEAEVRFRGILPDLFREGQAIVADGVWNGQFLMASKVLAKHDENYIPPELKGQHQEYPAK